MPNGTKNNLISDIRPRLKVSPAAYADTTFQALSEKVADDYDSIIKSCIVPSIGETHGLKIRELRVMACLEFYEDALTPAHVAAMLRYDPATVTRAVTRLIESNMITKESNLQDTRSVLLALTDNGHELAKLYAKRVKTVFLTLESMIDIPLSTQEKTEFLTVMYKISKRTEAMRTCADALPPIRDRDECNDDDDILDQALLSMIT